jgi:hypothetical protein
MADARRDGIPLAMRYLPRRLPLLRFATLLAALPAACGRDANRPLAHRGFEAGMPEARFRQAASGVGSLECGPFQVEGVAATQLCATSNSASGIRVVGALGAPDSLVRYVVVQEPDSGGSGFGALVRAWGAPDTLVETGRRWRKGGWIADADTAGGRLTIWLTDTATEGRIARHSLAAAEALADTTPLRNQVSAVLDTIRQTSPPGAPIPATPAEVDAPPRVIQCRQAAVPDALAAVDGAVSLLYVVDTTGRAEPPSIRVVEASRRGFVAPAIATIGTCTFTPGRQRGRALRVLVQQQVGFHPQAGK